MTPGRVRVCHVITRLNVGGATEAALNACAFLDRDRFDTVLIAGPETGSEGDLRPRAAALDVRVEVIPELIRAVNPLQDVRALRALRRFFRAEQPDIVHTHSSKAGVVGRRAARRAGVPAVVHTVHGWSFHDYMSRWRRELFIRLERVSARSCDRIFTVSNLDRAKGLAARIGRPDQYVVIHELNDLDRFRSEHRAHDDGRTRLGLRPDARVVGTVGRISEQKDPLTFVHAAARILDDVPDAWFVMVGDGPLRPRVEEAARGLGVDGRLVLTGLRDNVPEILPAFDVFLLTSLWEGLPLVIPQAMAAGVPVVASTADGNREVIRDGENGLLAPPQTPDLFAERTVRLLRSPDLVSRCVTAGRTTAEEFTLEHTIPQLEQHYLACVETRAAV